MTFPFEAVRDLLGVTRALRAAADPRAERVRDHYAAIEWELEAALRLAAEAREGGEAERLAMAHAERAALHVGDLVALTDSSGAIVRAAMRRVR